MIALRTDFEKVSAIQGRGSLLHELRRLFVIPHIVEAG
jgi:hypothetical protein